MYGISLQYTGRMTPISGVMNMSKGEKPVFRARAKTDPRQDFMVTIGAASRFREGEGHVVRLETVPVTLDGSFILVPPREGEDQAPDAPPRGARPIPLSCRRPNRVRRHGAGRLVASSKIGAPSLAAIRSPA